MCKLNTPQIAADFFEARGLVHCLRGFLDPAAVADLAATMRSSQSVPATVYKEDDTNRDWRKTRELLVPQAARAALTQQLLARLPEINAHYGTQAKAIQLMQFLLYEQGDYFAPHVDWSDEHDYGIPTRLVSFVLFLSVQGPDSFTGGELVFYVPRPGLARKDQVGVTQMGLALQPEAGMLICFDPHLMHEVMAVDSGQRLTVAGWFC